MYTDSNWRSMEIRIFRFGARYPDRTFKPREDSRLV